MELKSEICIWNKDMDGYYHTTCGEIVQSILEIDGMKYCPYCGKHLLPTESA